MLIGVLIALLCKPFIEPLETGLSINMSLKDYWKKKSEV